MRGERQYRILFERNLAGVYRTSLDGRILDCNEAFARIFGFASRSEALQYTAHDLYPSAANREASVGRLRARGGAVANSEDCMMRRDGRPVWVLVNETLLPVGRGEEPVIQGTLIDITQRKLAEESLRQERDFISAIVDTAGLLVLVCDRAGRVVRASRGVQTATGYGEEEITGRPCWEVFTLEDERGAVQEWFSRLEPQAKPVQTEVPCRARDGGERRIAWSVSYLRDAAGAIEFVIGTGVDVTDQRRLEGQLRQAQKMDAIGQMAGGIAHDFNNLLTVITGHCEIMLDASLQDPTPPVERVAKVKAAADRAVALTRQLLAFSRAQMLAPQVLELNQVVAAAHDLLRPLLSEQVELRIALAPAAGRVSADPVQIEQVIMNLAINARDAMPEGGVITFETANAEIDELYRRAHPMAKPGSYVMLAVSDNGMGMDEATRARIFEPFFTTKAQGRGTGLGLATVYGIVKQSNGYIWVYSEPGRGTTFKVLLPRVPAAEPGAQPGAAAPARGAGETVLVVEDNAAARGLTREMLGTLGYRVVEAPSPAAAARETRVDLLLTDLVLPETTGAELAEQLRRRHPGMQVLYTSGYTRAALEARGLLPEGAQFLAKPFTAHTLAAGVRNLLDACPAAAPAAPASS
ncbi:MAG: PAS domain S-box protein [Terriglobales bacterium]